MSKRPASRLVIPHHARQSTDLDGVAWELSGEAVHIGLVDRHVEQDVSLPSESVAPHLSLTLLIEGRGHFLMGGDVTPCQFLSGHCLLSCGWEPFGGEDFIPAHTHFQAVLFRYPLNLRLVFGEAAPVPRTGCDVYPHPRARAWLARLPMMPWMLDFANELIAQGLPTDPLALLRAQAQALKALHDVAAELAGGQDRLEQEGAGVATGKRMALTGRDRRSLLDARRHIDAHVAEALSVAGIAAASGLNEATLKQGFRQLFGASVYDYVLQSRCQRAAELLRTTALAMPAVAERCGFAHASHLAKHFRRRYDATPLQYRKQHG